MSDEREKRIADARMALDIEARAVTALKARIGDDFLHAVDLILACEGKVVVTGIGKSGNICRKIAATLASTGTPALFLHPTEGLHGDLGVISPQDVVVAVSNSGETAELLAILPSIKRLGAPLVALTGRADSTLAKMAVAVIDISVEEEACPNGLAPTASTTATLAMGDALAVVLLQARGFQAEDFARLHPGGSLGKRLLTRVSDIMHSGDAMPAVKAGATVAEAIVVMTGKRLGLTLVVGAGGELDGLVTDGDLRRALATHENLQQLPVEEIMTRSPRAIAAGALVGEALAIMENHKITALVAMDGENLAGVIHLHDIL